MEKSLPAIIAINSASPMPTGARNVLFCFSAASIKTVKTSRAVKNISMNTPCAIDVPPPSCVRTLSGPGNNAETTAAAVIPPSI